MTHCSVTCCCPSRRRETKVAPRPHTVMHCPTYSHAPSHIVIIICCCCCCCCQVDSKKDLEKQLKSVCEAFIMAVTKVGQEYRTVLHCTALYLNPSYANFLLCAEPPPCTALYCHHTCTSLYCAPLPVLHCTVSPSLNCLSGCGGAHVVLHHQGHGRQGGGREQHTCAQATQGPGEGAVARMHPSHSGTR